MYLGLLDENGTELACPGYGRRSLTDMAWGLTMPDERRHGDVDLRFFNKEKIVWRASGDWPVVHYVATFRDVMDDQPFAAARLEKIHSRPCRSGDLFQIQRGGFELITKLAGIPTATNSGEEPILKT